MPELVGTREVLKKLDQTMNNMKKAATVALAMSGAEVVVYAKKNAPWRDRTGNARRSIHSEQSRDGMSVSVGIGVPYGKYLEISRGGRYRVIDPAVFSYGKAVLARNLRSIL